MINLKINIKNINICFAIFCQVKRTKTSESWREATLGDIAVKRIASVVI